MLLPPKRRRLTIQIAIALVLLADLALVGVNWQLRLAPRTAGDQLRVLRHQQELMTLDLRRAEAIRRDLPAVQRQCDEFFQKQLRPSDGGYSTILADLGGMARESGLQLNSTRFKQHEVTKHGVNEITISLNMEGPYPSLVSFINALERSDNFYMLDTLGLDTSTNGVLRLTLELRTYFRS
jgi:Tfp pilus assembly protein PilO